MPMIIKGAEVIGIIMSDQRKIIFLHLPKTGGTTLVNMLHQKYGLQQSQLINGDKDSQLRLAVNNEIRFIHGHFSFDIVKLLHPHDYFSATVLREPVARVISRYVHLQYSEEPRLVAERDTYAGFEEYLESSYALNWQCQVLAGNMHNIANPEENYALAQQNLHSFDWVGVADYLNEGMLDLSSKLGFENRYYPHLNKSQSQELGESLFLEFAEEIRERNIYDQKLYAEAKRMYTKNKKLTSSALLKMKFIEMFGPSQPKIKD
jgi:hypothetical protein